MKYTYRFVVTVKLASTPGGYQSHFFDESLTQEEAFDLAKTIVRDGWMSANYNEYVLYSPSSIHSVSFS